MAEDGDGRSLGSGYHWLGSEVVVDSFQRSPYLLLDGDEAVLFDPGPAHGAAELVAALRSLVAPEKVAYVVVHDEDPDLSSALPALQASGMRFRVVTHWRTWSFLRFSGLEAPVYLIDEHGNSLLLASGRRLQFVAMPHLPSAGSFVTYDRSARTLLSGDLFGAFRPAWSLEVDDAYLEGMKAFHEHYMPSNDLLRPAMSLLKTLELDRILPGRGAVIADRPQTYIEALAGLDCGRLLGPASPAGGPSGDLEGPIERLMVRLSALLGPEKAAAAAAEAGLGWDTEERKLLGGDRFGEALWEKLIDAIGSTGGKRALTLMEPYVAILCGEYSLPRPKAYGLAEIAVQPAAGDLSLEVVRLRQVNDELLRSARRVQESLTEDAVTGLSNETYFRNFIDEQASLRLYDQGVEDDVLAVIGVDEGMARIEYQYGPKEVEIILRGIARVIQGEARETMMTFRLHGASFALWMPAILFHEALELCERIRTAVDASKAFIEHVTASIGIVSIADIREEGTDPSEAGSALIELGTKRLREARKRGGNTLCSALVFDKDAEVKAKILIVDDDAVNADVVKTFLENADFLAVEARDGDEALQLVAKEGFDLIISELMIPKLDGFMLKESLTKKSGTKDIPFILLSHLKDEATVVRAYGLGIDYYLRKPFLLSELIGMVQNLLAVRTV